MIHSPPRRLPHIAERFSGADVSAARGVCYFTITCHNIFNVISYQKIFDGCYSSKFLRSSACGVPLSSRN